MLLYDAIARRGELQRALLTDVHQLRLGRRKRGCKLRAAYRKLYYET